MRPEEYHGQHNQKEDAGELARLHSIYFMYL